MRSIFHQLAGKKRRTDVGKPLVVAALAGVVGLGSLDAATFVVTSPGDSGAGTLRQAILNANATVGDDTIVFQLPPSLSAASIELATALPSLSSNIVVVNDRLTDRVVTVQRSFAGTTPNFRIFNITAGARVTIAGLTITRGMLNGNTGTEYGGGVLNTGGDLTLRNCTINSNNVASSGAVGEGGNGSAIYNDGRGGNATLTLLNCTIANNSAGRAGTIVNNGSAGSATLTMTNCTLHTNVANAVGAQGVLNNGVSGTAIANLVNSTFSENNVGSAGTDPACIVNSGNGGTATLTLYSCSLVANPGGGVTNKQGTVEFGNTVFQRGFSGANITNTGGIVVSAGFNLSDDAAGGGAGTAPGGFLNSAGDKRNTNAQLIGLRADNGGPTPTHRPGPNSPVLDQGKSFGVATDQRGEPRQVDLPGSGNAAGGDGSDIGAVENGLPQTGPDYVVTSTNSGGPFESDGVCTNDECSLQEAIVASNANPDANTISFRRDVRGSITTQFVNGFNITQPVTIAGAGARILSLNGGNAARIFNVSGPNVTIAGLTLTSGRVFGANGGAIQNTGGLSLVDCSLTSNTATASNGSAGLGGAVYNASGATIAVRGCTFSGNSAGRFGGGLFNEGTAVVTNCTFAFNNALRGGGVMSRANDAQASMLLRNCTIANNTATDGAAMAGGGGCSVEGAAAQHHVANTIIAGNTSTNNPDVRGDYASDGHNLIGNKGASSGFIDGVNGDQIGGGALPNRPANLGSFRNNGGPTDTLAPLSTSTVRDAGDDALAGGTDQRGYPRIGVSDIGAVEFASANLAVTEITRTGGNDVAVRFQEAVAGNSYRLERKLQLTEAVWQPIAGVADLSVSAAAGSATIVHPGGATEARAFYRVRLLP